MAAAQAKALGITELLEEVLHFLPVHDLLMVQRVCIKWRHVIQRSEGLQQTLFIKAYGGQVLSSFVDSEHKALIEAAPASDPCEFLSGRRTSFMRWSDSVENTIATVPLINPLLPRIWDFNNRTATIHITPAVQSIAPPLVPSWHSMFLTQPPVTRITVLNKDDHLYTPIAEHDLSLMTPLGWPHQHPRHSPVTNPSGLTFADIIEHLKEEYVAGSFELLFEPTAPLSGSYWRRITEDRLTASSLSRFVRKYTWEGVGESPIGWDPTEDGVDHLGGPLDGIDDPRRSDDTDYGYYRVLAGRRAGIGTINGKPIFGPERPPGM